MRAFVILMSRAETMTRITYNDTMAMKMLIVTEPLIQRNAASIITAIRNMSSMSVSESSRKPKICSSIVNVYICAKILNTFDINRQVSICFC